MNDSHDIKAEVIAVFPDKVKILVGNISAFANDKSLKVGSYLRITDSEDCALIAIIENFCIEVTDKAERRHLIEALPLGIIADGKFIRGGDTLTIPPTGVAPATEEDIKKIFEDSIEPAKKFAFSGPGFQRKDHSAGGRRPVLQQTPGRSGLNRSRQVSHDCQDHPDGGEREKWPVRAEQLARRHLRHPLRVPNSVP